MHGSRSALGVVAGGGLGIALLLADQIALAYTAFALGFLAFCFTTSLSLNWQILIGALLGVGFGLIIQGYVPNEMVGIHAEPFTVIGRIFIGLLKMMIAPMIFLSIVFGISQMAAARDLGRIGARTVGLYVFTMVLAVATGLVVVNVFEPGEGSALRDSQFFRTAITEQGASLPSYDSLPQFLLETLYQVLSNPFASLAGGQILAIVVFAILLGIALLQIGSTARPLVDIIGAGYRAVMHIIGWIIRLAPVGILGLIGKLVATVPFANLVENLGEFALVVIAGIFVHAFVTLPLVAYLLAGLGPAELFRGIREAMLVAFSTSSSAATLPVTTRCVEENLGVPPRVSSFVLPLGATVNMDGTALYEAIAAIFIANVLGIEMPLGMQIVIFLVAMITAIGAPAIPSAGMVTMIVVLQSVGLPGEAVGILIPIDRFLDTFRTMTNVEGDAVVSLCVARSSP